MNEDASTLRQRKKLPVSPSAKKVQEIGREISIRNPPKDRALSGVSVTAAEADAILQQLADRDQDNKKTWSRVFVERYLLNKNWYYPQRPNRPDLKRAWAYWEHVTLPRHFTTGADTGLRRAEPGEHEEETELYDPFRTPQKAFVDWGTGVDLYFICLICFAAFMFVAALINIPSMMYYGSAEYNGGIDKNEATDALTGEVASLPFVLEHSAVCTNTQWVVCPTCSSSSWRYDRSRWAQAADGTILVVRNFCAGTQFENAFTNWATLVAAVIWTSLVSLYLRARGVRFDEDKTTTSDYSINVKNPPPDAYDPEEWRDFFSQFATGADQVTCVTVTLDNEELLRNTFYYRNFRSQLLRMIPSDTDIEDEAATNAAISKYLEENGSSYYIESGWIGWTLKNLIVPPCNIFNMLLPPDKLYSKMKNLKEKIKVLQEKEYKVSQIFVTFEKEEGQRTALSALQLGMLDILTKNKEAVGPTCLFRGKLLNVVQPAEPNAVRWLDLDDSPIKIFIMSIATLIGTLLLIAFASLCIFYARRNVGPFFSGILVTTFNSTIPQVIKILMWWEPHQTEGGFQTSLYLKITLFRWVLTAIVPQIITPSTSALGSANSDLVPTIRGILVSECWLSPLLRLLDYMTNAKKHIIAPRAQNQEDMMLWFQGTFYNLGERYTDLTKILFVVYFYSGLFPFVFVFGFIILTIQYGVDRFSLFRLWGWNPVLGSDLATFSRKYMFLGCLGAFAIVNAYVFSQFPYDNVCNPTNPQSGVSGTYTDVRFANGELVYEGQPNAGTVQVTQDTTAAYCNQDWRDYDGFSFPPTARIQGNGLKWFTETQDRVTAIYGWTALVIVIVIVLYLFGRSAIDLAKSIFTGVYQPEGDSQHIDYSSNPEIFAYVPQLKFASHPFPYLCCDIDDIDQGLIGWNDASHSYDYYNLLFEIPHPSLRRTERIEKNTRHVTTIADADGYDQAVASSVTEVPTTGKQGTEVALSGVGAERRTPLYSIVKHFPTKWQIELTKAIKDSEA